MKKFFFTSILLLGFCTASFAQNAQPVSCPEIVVSGPPGIVKPGETATFTVDVDGAETAKLIYNWTTTTGEIIEGQGTSTITVKTPKEWTQSLHATVELNGLPTGCPSTYSEVVFWCQPLSAEKVDEFGQATNGNVKMRFDSFMVELQNDPNAQGYILNFGSDREIAKRERQIRNAIAFRKFDASRITIVRAGETDDLIKTQFWIVPAGATPPTP